MEGVPALPYLRMVTAQEAPQGLFAIPNGDHSDDSPYYWPTYALCLSFTFKDLIHLTTVVELPNSTILHSSKRLQAASSTLR